MKTKRDWYGGLYHGLMAILWSIVLVAHVMQMAGCDQPPNVRYVETCSASAEHQNFIIACVAAGNPMSDEEGEDLVAQCEKTAKHLFEVKCQLKPECHGNNGGLRPLVECGLSEPLTSDRPEKTDP